MNHSTSSRFAAIFSGVGASRFRRSSGSVFEPPGYRAPTDVERAKSLQSAITWILRGDLKWAASVLEQSLYHAPNDSLIALAAKIELEALRSGITR